MTVSGGAGPNNSSETAGDNPINVHELICAIDDLHEYAWRDGESGDLRAHKRADRLAAALGWTGDHGTTPTGDWMHRRLAEALVR